MNKTKISSWKNSLSNNKIVITGEIDKNITMRVEILLDLLADACKKILRLAKDDDNICWYIMGINAWCILAKRAISDSIIKDDTKIVEIILAINLVLLGKVDIGKDEYIDINWLNNVSVDSSMKEPWDNISRLINALLSEIREWKDRMAGNVLIDNTNIAVF